ncbi:putative methyltransferase DDB_G0268948 [Ptychodera flava]|uniref:putative methyltransferase DDB_G0268948 n=1 Tax=Ptychodera flava TaxID=63121 RepID=UPI003969EAB0
MSDSNSKERDLFQSTISSEKYSAYRIPYPNELPEKIVSILSKKRKPPHTLALDVACGTGLGTRILAKHFQRVIGLDISETQIAEATAIESSPNVTYQVCAAHSLPVDSNSVDLVTVATAIQWLDLETFYPEIDRVLKPGGCLMVYGCTSRSMKYHYKDKSGALTKLYNDTLYDTYIDYWTYRKPLQWNHYRDLPLPYKENERDDSMSMKDEVTVDDVIGYTSSLSFFEKYEQDHSDADRLLQDLQNRIMDILDVKTAPDKTVVGREFPLFLVSSRKPSEIT